MSLRMKFAAVLGAMSMLFVFVANPAEARVRKFALAASQNTYNVTCAPGASQGTSSIKIKVVTRGLKRITSSELGDDTGRAKLWVASWQGGRITMNRTNKYFPAQDGVTFPCPATVGAPAPFKITVQGFRGTVALGTPATYWMTMFRVGSPS